jgi:hypothetical protein
MQFNILTYYLKLDWVFLFLPLDRDTQLVRAEGCVVVAGIDKETPAGMWATSVFFRELGIRCKRVE